MILLVSMAEPGDDYASHGAGAWANKLRFEQLSGQPCIIQHYSQVTPERCRQIGARAIFISGFGYAWEQFVIEQSLGLFDVVRSLEWPILGACGGHQFLGYAFSKDFRRKPRLKDEPMRRLAKGEPDFNPDYHPGWYVETGMQPVEIVKRDPLFSGLPRVMMMREAHYCEVKQLPPDFELLATNANCAIQAMRHVSAPIYGVQFHPEAYTEHYDHGKKLVANWLRMAKG